MKKKLAILTIGIVFIFLQVLVSLTFAQPPAGGDAAQKASIWYFWTNQTGKGSYAVENGSECGYNDRPRPQQVVCGDISTGV